MRVPAPRRSIKYELPLLISALLLAVVASLSLVAYRALEKALVAAAGDRMVSAVHRLLPMFDESAVRLRRTASQVAADSAVARFFTAPNDASRAAVARVVNGQSSAQSPIVAFEILDSAGKPVLVSGIFPERSRPVRQVTAAPDTAGRDGALGPLVARDGAVYFAAQAPVLGRNRDTLGYVVEHRKLSSGESARLITGLIGSDADLLLGNSDGSVWTDLASVKLGPRAVPANGAATAYATADGERWIGAAAAIPHAPWTLWVQLPRRTALAPARRFLLEGGLVGLFIVLAGTAGAWLLSRRITTPFAEVDQELSESESRYRALVEFSPDAVIVHCDGSFIFLNAAAATLFGVDRPDELIGHSVIDVVHPEDRASVQERVRQVQDDRVSTPLAERRVLRRDGSVVTIEAIGMPITLDGRPATLSILRDITARKQLEQQLAQAQKMEAVGQLAGGIAHDFNNLLTVITSYSAMALQTLDSHSPVRADIEEIQKASGRAADLTKQLLAFSRKQFLQPVVLDLNEIVAGVDKMLRRLIPEHIQLVARCAPTLDFVRADPGQIEQVLVNLAVNARDAMPNGGRIVIETANVALTSADVGRQLSVSPGAYVMLAVADTGTGIAPELQRRIFEPFFTTKERGRGTGLGLATVYGIVKQSGGDLALESELGRGSTFKVYLPRVEARAAQEEVPVAEPTSVPAVARGNETLLIVEDDASVRGAVAAILRHAGYTVIEAGTEEDAIALCDVPAPELQLILTDLVMPGMGGRELARELQQRRPKAAVLFMSGYTEDEVMHHRFVEREAAFIGKPFTPERLSRAVRAALDARVTRVA